MCICVSCGGRGMCTVAEPRRRYQIPWSWAYIWLWEAWYRPSGRAVYAVDRWAIYPALMSCFCQGIFWEQQRSNYDNTPPSVSSGASVTGGTFLSLSNPLLPTHSQLLPGCFKLHHVLGRVLVMTQSKTAAKGNCLPWPLSRQPTLVDVPRLIWFPYSGLQIISSCLQDKVPNFKLEKMLLDGNLSTMVKRPVFEWKTKTLSPMLTAKVK